MLLSCGGKGKNGIMVFILESYVVVSFAYFQRRIPDLYVQKFSQRSGYGLK